MIWYLLSIAYLGGLLASSVVFADRLVSRTGRDDLGDLDREDWLVLAFCSLLWPLVWLAALWLAAYAAWRTRRIERTLIRYGASLGSTDDAA